MPVTLLTAANCNAFAHANFQTIVWSISSFVIVSQDSDSFDGQSFRYVSELWLAWVGKIAGKKEFFDQIKGDKTQNSSQILFKWQYLGQSLEAHRLDC